MNKKVAMSKTLEHHRLNSDRRTPSCPWDPKQISPHERQLVVSKLGVPLPPSIPTPPKQPQQPRHPRHEQERRSTHIPPRHAIPAPHIEQMPIAHHRRRSHQMPNIRYRQRDDIVPYNFRLRCRVKQSDRYHCKQQIDVAELQGDDVCAESQVLRAVVQDLVGDEGVRV